MSQDGATRLLEALRALDEMADQGSGKNRRAHERFRVRGQGSLIFDPHTEFGAGRPRQFVHIRDVSRGGFGLLCPGPVELHRACRLVCVADGVELCSVLVAATHVSEVLDGVYLAGCSVLIEAATMVSLGVRLHEIAVAEERVGGAAAEGDFSPVLGGGSRDGSQG